MKQISRDVYFLINSEEEGEEEESGKHQLRRPEFSNWMRWQRVTEIGLTEDHFLRGRIPAVGDRNEARDERRECSW